MPKSLFDAYKDIKWPKYLGADYDKVWLNEIAGTYPERFQNLAIMPRTKLEVYNEGENEPIEVDRLTIDTCGELMEFIQQEIYRLRRDYGVEPDFILFGAEEFEKVAGVAYRNNIYGFEMHIDHARWEKRGTLFGIRIRVTPTIRGYCVVPKER